MKDGILELKYEMLKALAHALGLRLISLGGRVAYLRRTSEIMIVAVALGSAPSVASAGVCDHVNRAVTGAGAALTAAKAYVEFGPFTAVMHSSGAWILTGPSGYVANTIGFVGGAWAVLTSPITLPLAAAVVSGAAGATVACRYAAQGPAKPAR